MPFIINLIFIRILWVSEFHVKQEKMFLYPHTKITTYKIYNVMSSSVSHPCSCVKGGVCCHPAERKLCNRRAEILYITMPQSAVAKAAGGLGVLEAPASPWPYPLENLGLLTF